LLLSIYSKVRDRKRKFGEVHLSNKIYTVFTSPQNIVKLLKKTGFKLLWGQTGFKWINLFAKKC